MRDAPQAPDTACFGLTSLGHCACHRQRPHRERIRHCPALPHDARRCRQPSSDYSTPDKCKRILNDLGESYDNDADVTTLQIKAAQAVKRTKTGVRLNFEESVTAAELERLPSVEKLLNWRDEVYAKRFVNKGPITIKCLIGQVRPPASPLPAPPSLPSAKANPRAAGSTCTASRARPRSAA